MRLISQNGIADIVVMRSLYVIEEYHVFELHGVADNAVSAYERTAADECAVAYLGAVIYDAGSPYIGGGEDLCVLRNPDILARMIEFVLREGFPNGKNGIRDSGKRLPGIFTGGEQLACTGLGKIKQIVGFIHGFPFGFRR